MPHLTRNLKLNEPCQRTFKGHEIKCWYYQYLRSEILALGFSLEYVTEKLKKQQITKAKPQHGQRSSNHCRTQESAARFTAIVLRKKPKVGVGFLGPQRHLCLTVCTTLKNVTSNACRSHRRCHQPSSITCGSCLPLLSNLPFPVEFSPLLVAAGSCRATIRVLRESGDTTVTDSVWSNDTLPNESHSRVISVHLPLVS